MRSLIKLSLAVGVLLSANLAQSIELLEAISLPGAGGKPIGTFMDYTDDSCMIAGSYNDSLGRRVPTIWDVRDDGVLDGMSTLPMPSGYTGEAVGGAMFPNGDIAVVGNVFVRGSEQNPRAALWRKAGLGTYQITILTPGMSRISGCEYGGAANPHLAVVGGTYMGGRWRGYFNDIMISTFAAQILPYIEQDAFAMGVDMDGEGEITIFGWATFPSSLRKPCRWEGPDFDSVKFISIPSSDQGEAADGDVDGADFLAWGRLYKGDRIRGGVYNGDPGQGLIGLLLPQSGFMDATIGGPLYLGDTGTHEVGHWMGMSTNPNGSSSPTVWTDMRPMSAQQLLLEPLSITLTDVMISSYRDEANEDMDIRVMGQSGGTNGSTGQVLLPSEIIVPDAFNLMAGAIPARDWHMADLWHNDSRELVLRTELINGQRLAVMDVSLGRVMGYEQTLYPLESTFSVIGRALGSGFGVGGRVRVHLYNFETQEFVQLEEVMISSVTQQIDVHLTDARPFLNPSTWEMRACIEFLQTASRPTALSLNFIGIKE